MARSLTLFLSIFLCQIFNFASTLSFGNTKDDLTQLQQRSRTNKNANASKCPNTSPDSTYEVSLLTEGPSSDVYTTWGHITLRIKNQSGSDMTYGFGTFDFSTSWFYLKFIQGSLDYTGSIYPYSLYYQEEIQDPHYIVEQVLNLSLEQKRVVKNELNRLNLPENRFYRNDFLYVNCSTKIRDIIEKAIRPGSLFSRNKTHYSRTFRQELQPYMLNSPWLEFGTDLVLGLPTDKKTSPFETAFLPLNLYSLVKSSKNNSGIPLVKSERTISLATTTKPSDGVSPVLTFSIILICAILLSFIRNTGHYIDLFLFPLTGILGIVIFYLWFISEHTATKDNLNLIWAFPLNLAYPLLKQKTKRLYAICMLFICAAFLAAWSLIPQHFNPAVAPIILLLFYRFLIPAGLIKAGNQIGLN